VCDRKAPSVLSLRKRKGRLRGGLRFTCRSNPQKGEKTLLNVKKIRDSDIFRKGGVMSSILDLTN